MAGSWHSKNIEEALAELKVTEKGLNPEEAKSRLDTYGLNG